MWFSPMALQHLSIDAAAHEVAALPLEQRTQSKISEILARNGVTYMSPQEKEFFADCVKTYSRY